MAQHKDIKKPFGGLNFDDAPSNLPEGDYTDALNARVGSSKDQHETGLFETLQGEVELLIQVAAEFLTYYGDAIGGDFLYEGFEEVQIGNQVWMKNNWDDDYPGSKVFNDDEDNVDVYGRLYNHNHIMSEGFLPTGWKVPTTADIDEMLEFLGGQMIAGGKMKEAGDEHWQPPNTGADDESGFRALPGGMFDVVFGLLGQRGLFWLAEEEEEEPVYPLLDRDGNEYTTVIIGGKEIIVENLKTTKYADGTAIPNITSISDWFMPSDDELNAMYVNLHLFGVGDFADATYWSSTEEDNNSAHFQYFGDGSTGINDKDEGLDDHVRACRSFVAGIGDYALRDIGPGGGLIFYISGTTYYEAAPSDQSTNCYLWSNIIDVEIGAGAQGTAIGTGITNTAAIIGQAGHTSSGAQLCDDYESMVDWINDTDGAYCWYNNDIANRDSYGALYNGYAIRNVRGLAYFERNGVQEEGWRVTTDPDWSSLLTSIGGTGVAGGKLKEVGLTHWNTPNAGATDEFGFKGRGGGRRHQGGTFSLLHLLGMYWTGTIFDADRNYYYYLAYNNDDCLLCDSLLNAGYAVRCIRDIE